MASTDGFRTQFSFRRVYAGGWAVLASRPIALLGVSLLANAPIAAVETFAGLRQASPGGRDSVIWEIAFFTATLLGLVATYFTLAAITSLMVDGGPGRRSAVGDAAAMGLRLMFPMLLQSLLVSMAIGAGLVLLIVPGLIFMTMWSVASVVLVAERAGPIASISRSARLTEGLRIRTFFTLLPILTLYVLLFFGLQGFSSAGPEEIARSNLSLGIASNIATRVFPPLLFCAFSVSLYRELFAIKGSDVHDDLAGVFA